jgi:hypothetical protein
MWNFEGIGRLGDVRVLTLGVEDDDRAAARV